MALTMTIVQLLTLLWVAHLGYVELATVQDQILSAGIYTGFRNLFDINYKKDAGDQAFVVMLFGGKFLPTCLMPKPLDMNRVDHPMHRNYIAHTQTFSGGYAELHSEWRVINSFNSYISKDRINSEVLNVLFVSHFNPCEDCVESIKAFKADHGNRYNVSVAYVKQRPGDDVDAMKNNLRQEGIGFFQIWATLVGCHENPQYECKVSELNVCDVPTTTTTTTRAPDVHEEGGSVSGDGGGGGGGCFPGSSRALLPDLTSVPMNELEVGQQVMAMDSEGHLVASEVILMLDYQPFSALETVVMATSHGDVMKASLEHLVLVSHDGTVSAALYKRAKHVQVGDYIFTSQSANRLGNSVKSAEVTNITVTQEEGAFAPVTTEGTIIVDGSVASCYAEVPSHYLAHLALAPVRLAHSVVAWWNWSSGGKSSHHQPTRTGVHWYANSLHNLYKMASIESYIENFYN